MTNRLLQLAYWAMVLGLTLSACGGGRVAIPTLPLLPPPPPDPSTLLPGDFVAMGPLPAGGEFVIANVNINSAGAEVTINREPGILSQLQPGHIIGVIGTTNASRRSTALELFFDANIIGDVDSVDTVNDMLVVLGQPVSVDADTVFATPLQNISRDDLVQVSGYTNVDGLTVATRIDLLSAGNGSQLIGTVDNLNSASFEFDINDLSVDYSSAVLIDVQGGEVQEGIDVLITGVRLVDGSFDAATIEQYDRDLTDQIGAQVRAQGEITHARSGADFSVNGFPVTMGGQRDYREGSDADIIVGESVRVEGEILGNADIQVHRVWFLRD